MPRLIAKNIMGLEKNHLYKYIRGSRELERKIHNYKNTKNLRSSANPKPQCTQKSLPHKYKD